MGAAGRAAAVARGHLRPRGQRLGEQRQQRVREARVADALGSAKLLKHRDPDVKLLTACCLSDVMRIYAPNTPYDDDALKMIFELFN